MYASLKPIAYSLTALLVLVFYQPSYFGRIEGKLWPVVTRAELTEVIDQGSDIWIFGTTEKVRDCQFEGLEWRLGDSDQSIPVRVIFLDGEQIRPAGSIEFGPWLIHLTKEQFETQSFARTTHKCHPGWHTITDFWP